LTDARELLQSSDRAAAFYEGMLARDPDRINSGALWGGAMGWCDHAVPTSLTSPQVPISWRSEGHRQVVDLVWCCQDWSFVAMAARYKGYRYPIEVIGHAVFLYHRFGVS
jgi:hypothetical protein